MAITSGIWKFLRRARDDRGTGFRAINRYACKTSPNEPERFRWKIAQPRVRCLDICARARASVGRFAAQARAGDSIINKLFYGAALSLFNE